MGQDSSQSPNWRDWIQRGTEAFRHARYAEAISAFQTAAGANPKSPVPHLYLALVWLQQYIPGAVSTENPDRARQAEEELRLALDADPTSEIAFALLGQLAHQQGKLEEAREWYRKAAAVEPGNANTWCTLGGIAFQHWYQQGKPAGQPTLEEAIAAFEKSIELDPVHEVAMQYLSLALRERAGTRGGDESRNDLAAAGRWQEKSADARAEKVQAAIARNYSSPAATDDPDALLKLWASMAAMPPPPPSPPPGRGAPSSGLRASSATIRWEPAAKGANPVAPVRVAPVVQARKLLTKVDPETPPDAQPEDPMRFVVVIGQDGRVVRETCISGNPWLVQTAAEALRQWVYQPTLVNGKPIAVVTEVRVECKSREDAP